MKRCNGCLNSVPEQRFPKFTSANGKTYRRNLCRDCYSTKHDQRKCEHCGLMKFRNRYDKSSPVCQACVKAQLSEHLLHDYAFARNMLGLSDRQARDWLRRGYRDYLEEAISGYKEL